MSNRNRKRVLLKPKSSTERAIRSRYSAAEPYGAALIALTFCGQWLAFWSTTSVGAKRWERISAELLLGASRELHSDDNMRRLGLREVECTCPPGKGHNAPLPLCRQVLVAQPLTVHSAHHRAKVALVAVMRKLLLQLNAVARRGTPWTAQFQPTT